MRRLLASVASAALLAGMLGAPAASAPPADASAADAPAEESPQRIRQAAPLPSVQADGRHLIRLMAGAFDPRSDPAPAVEGFAAVNAAQLPAGRPAYWLVQVAEKDFAGATAAIEAAGGAISGFVNDAAYIVRATREQISVIAGDGAVRAVVPYQPGWKVPQALGEYEALMDLEGPQMYQVYAFRTEQPQAVAQAVGALDGVDTFGTQDRVIDVRATAAELPAIAAVTGVEWIETKPTVAPMNMNARWVNDTGMRDVQHVITEKRLTGEGQTAAVADTALNYLPDFNSGAQSYFRDCTDDEGLVGCQQADYVQTEAGSTAAATQGTRPTAEPSGDIPADPNDRGRHRKMAAYFDIGDNEGISATPSNHGTHVSGSVNGDTAPYGEWNRADGLAPRSRLVHQSIETATGGLRTPSGDLLWRQAYRPRDPASVKTTWDPAEYENYDPDVDARTHNNSYGLIAPNVSLGSAEAADRFVWEHEDMVIVSSAGNSGPGPYTIGAPSIGKNVVTSGASANGRQPMVSIDSMASFSSHGPTPDGRLGVDLATPGQIVVSAKGGTDDEEHYLQGTSMSGPILTGLATLVRQYFWDGYGATTVAADPRFRRASGLAVGTRAKDTRGANPSAALVRATMVNGAQRMRGFYTGDDGANRSLDGQYPSAGQGFGLVNLDQSLFFTEADGGRRSRRATWFKDVWRGDGAAADANDKPFVEGAGATRTYEMDVAEGAPLNVTLAFTDAPSSPLVGTVARVNNLDLTVIAPDGTRYAGNNFNTRVQTNAGEYQTLSGPNYDANNPVERVRIPAPRAGVWRIEVRGTEVAMGPQGFALAANGNLSQVETAGQQPDAFNPGPPLQVDAAGAPTISDVRVESVSADLAKVTWSTSEPTTGAVVTTVNGAEHTYRDVYNHDRAGSTRTDGDQGYDGIREAPVESSDEYSNKPVVSDRHEVLVTGLSPGQTYQLNIVSSDLADPANTATQTTTMRSTRAIYGAQPYDMANLVEAPTDAAFDPILGIGDGAYGTSTQLYAGKSGGAGLLGAVMFRVPTSVDPSTIRGAAVEFSSAHDVTTHYTDDVRYYVDLLPDAMEENWQSQNYESVHTAPPQARTLPQTGYRRGANKVYPFSFGCGEIESLRSSLSRVSSTGDRRAAFRFDALTSKRTSLFSMEFGFNRRSKGADLRPRLVLYVDENRDGSVTDPRHCDATASAPQIDDLGVQKALRENSMTVSWRTDQPSDSTVFFRPKGSSAEFTQVHVPSLTTAHQVQILGVQPGTEYEFGVRSKTCNGNATTDDNGGAGYLLTLATEDNEEQTVPTKTLFFKGEQDDQANKMLGNPTATFGEAEPDEATPIQQTATQFAPADSPQSPYAAFWSGPFTGPLAGNEIDGDLTFDWWWSSGNAEALVIGAGVEITVFADVGEDTEAIIGREERRVSVGPTPTRNVTVVPVQGIVNDNLTVQVRTVFIDSGNDIRANYDAPSAPSQFTVPLEKPPPPPAPSEGLNRQAGPIPPESAASSVSLADVPTRQTPSSADISAGTAQCAAFQTAAADQPSTTGGGGGTTPTPSPSGSPSPSPSPTPTASPTPSPDGEPQPGDGPVDACDPEFVPTGVFDDIRGSVHRGNINCIAWYLITLGASNTRASGQSYAPDERVTRAQMASFIARLAVEGGIELPAKPRDHFRDDNGDVHERNINALAELGLVKGTSSGRYSPGKNVTRAQMATFIANVHRMAVGSAPRPSRDYFDDDNGNIHERNINTLAELRIVIGKRRGVYHPAARVTREQMATYIANDLRLFVNGDKAFAGGAEVLLEREADDDRTVDGEVHSRRQLTRLVADGCGLRNATVPVADDGTFRITIPPTQPAGECELRLTAHTKGMRTTEEQEVTYTFLVDVMAQPQ